MRNLFPRGLLIYLTSSKYCTISQKRDTLSRLKLLKTCLKDMSSNEEILKENIYKNYTKFGKRYKENSGIIIASGFSMTVLLLSFIEKRTIALEIGIFCLVVSLLFLFHLFLISSDLLASIYSKDDIQKFFAEFNKIQIINDFLFFSGFFFFFVGLFFIFIFFGIFPIAFVALLFVMLNANYDIIASILNLKSKVEIVILNTDFTLHLKKFWKFKLVSRILFVGIFFIISFFLIQYG
jgi:hypothetical protein